MKRKAPKELNKKVCKQMLNDGVKNQLYARYFRDISKACSMSGNNYFHNKTKLGNDLPNIIASKLVYDFLQRYQFVLTEDSINHEIEDPLNLFTDNVSLKVLKLHDSRPMIQKLIRQRFINSSDSDAELKQGWYNIESDIEFTMTGTEMPATHDFQTNEGVIIQRNAYDSYDDPSSDLQKEEPGENAEFLRASKPVIISKNARK